VTIVAITGDYSRITSHRDYSRQSRRNYSHHSWQIYLPETATIRPIVAVFDDRCGRGFKQYVRYTADSIRDSIRTQTVYSQVVKNCVYVCILL